MKKFTKIITAVALAFGLTGLVALPTYAAPSQSICDQDNVAPEVRAAAGCEGTNSGSLNTAIPIIINAIIGILGLVALIMIIIGGINYMTSQGDPGKTKKAKDTILYAAIGLAICILSFAIANFVIGAVNKATQPSSEDAYIVTTTIS